MTTPVYKVYVDWDGDGGLNIGDFEQDVEGWDPFAVGASLPTLARSTVRAYHGVASLLVTWSAGGTLQLAKPDPMPTFVVGRSYTMSAWVWVPSTGGMPAKLEVAGYSTGPVSSGTDQWVQITHTFTASVTTHQLQVTVDGTPAGGEQTWIDMVRVLGPGEDLTAVLPGVVSDVTVQYGRDQARSLQPMSPGDAQFDVDNVSRDLSPENSSSPLASLLGPGREVSIEATYGGKLYSLFTGSTDDFRIDTNPGVWLAKFSAIDSLARLKNLPVSTALYPALRTGEAVNKILDAVGWTGGRDIDPGATTLRWWYAESDDAFQVLEDVVSAEGPDAFVHIGSSAEFVFRDRHHRLLSMANGTAVDGAIEFIGVGTAAHAVNGPVTPGMPSGSLRPGDPMILFAAIRNSGAGTVDTPTGWDLKVDGSNMRAFGRYYRTGDTAPTVTFSGGVANADTSAQMAAFRGVTLDVVAATPVGSTLNGSAQDIAVAALSWTPAIQERLNIHFGWKADDWMSVDVVTNGIEIGEPDTTAGNDQGIVWNYRIVTPTAPFSTIGARTFTVTGGAAAISRGACLVLTRPTVQATFRDTSVVSPDVEHDPPFEIDFGWRDIVNQVEVSIGDRNPGPVPEEIWADRTLYSLAAGQSRQFTIATNDPFWNIQAPTQASSDTTDPDFIRIGGTLTITFSRTSGRSATMTITASAALTVLSMRLRAYRVSAVGNDQKILKQDTGSIAKNRGIKSYKLGPAVNAEDGNAIADLVLGKRAERTSTITFTVKNGTADQVAQQLSRDLSDRVRVVDSESGVDASFHIEHIAHTISDDGNTHETKFTAQKIQPTALNLFRFDTSGAGFNDGVFAPSGQDDPITMFIFDRDGHGFDQGLLCN